jgi:hypothetical protein
VQGISKDDARNYTSSVETVTEEPPPETPRRAHRGRPRRDCGNREQRGARRPKPIFIAPLPHWHATSSDDTETAMKTLAARMALATSVALATLTATEAAYAQDYHSYETAYVHRRHPTPPYAYDTQANPNYGFGPLVPVDPNDVVSGNRIIGRDPDPFIRGEILRHYDSGWPD